MCSRMFLCRESNSCCLAHYLKSSRAVWISTVGSQRKMMAQQTSALYEPMTGPLNIHPPTHPHLLRVIQQGLTHRQTQPQAHTQTHIHKSSAVWSITGPAQPIHHQKQKERQTKKKKSNMDTDRQTDRDQKTESQDMEKMFLVTLK